MSELNPEIRAAAEKSAGEYAWNWFEYHAGQRQAVFRFYIILAGAILTGYLTIENSNSNELKEASFFLGLALAFFSFLFWRLDERSRDLIVLAEAYLKVDEQRLRKTVDSDMILLAKNADEGRGKAAFGGWAYSFRQVYRIIFLFGGILGVVFFIFGIVD